MKFKPIPVPPDVNEIVLLGGGLSLDLAHPDEYRRQPGRLVVGLNGVTCLTPCDFVVLTDAIALAKWPPNALKAPGYCVAPAGMLAKSGAQSKWPSVRYLVGEEHVPGPRFKNARTLGLYLINELIRVNKQIEKVTYIGMDSGCLIETAPNGAHVATWQYAACLRKYALDSVQKERCFSGSRTNLMRFVSATGLANYKSYFPDVIEVFGRRPELLDCKSFVDWNKLRTGSPTYHVEQAFVAIESRNPKIPDFRWTNQPPRDTNVVQADIPIPRSKIKADTVWVVGCGPSLDLTRPAPEEVAGSDVILIAINAAIELYRDQATFGVITDPPEFERRYKGTKWPAWVVPSQTERYVKGSNAVWRVINHLIDPGPGRVTSGTAAVLLALVLQSNPNLNIKRVIVSGLDFASVFPQDSQIGYRYPRCLTPYVVGVAKSQIVPEGVYESPFKVRLSEINTYKEQARRIAGNMSTRFKAVVECRSFCDLTKLHPLVNNWAESGQLPKGAEKGKL